MGAHFIREPRPKDNRGKEMPEMVIVVDIVAARIRSMRLLACKGLGPKGVV